MLGSLLFVVSYQAIGVFCIGLLPMMRHSLNMAAFYGILALTLCGFSFPVECNATSIPILGRWFSGKTLHAYISESNTCRIRTKILSFILPLPADISASAINNYHPTQISSDLSEFYRKCT